MALLSYSRELLLLNRRSTFRLVRSKRYLIVRHTMLDDTIPLLIRGNLNMSTSAKLRSNCGKGFVFVQSTDDESNDSHNKDSKKLTSNNGQPKKRNNNISPYILFPVGIGITCLLLYLFNLENSCVGDIDLRTFKDLLYKGEIQAVYISKSEKSDNVPVYVSIHPGASVKGNMFPRVSIWRMYTNSPLVIQKMLLDVEQELNISPDRSIKIRSVPKSPTAIDLTYFILLTCVFSASVYFIRNFSAISKAQVNKGMFSSPLGKLQSNEFITVISKDSPHSDNVFFKDIAGIQSAKMEVMEFVSVLKEPSRFIKLGAKLPKGALLLGPPGTGKTLLAKALANEAGIPFLYVSGTNFCEMIGGLGAKRVRTLFKMAKERAPCIIYIDEVDAVGRKRSFKDTNQEGDQTLNQILTEMDGMASQRGIVVLASTNRHDILDAALTRPGRFDRHIWLDLPTMAERREIFEIYLGKVKIDKLPSEYSQILAELTPGLSGAGIAVICNEAAINAVRRGATVVSMRDFDFAIERSISGHEKKHLVMTKEERSMIAFHEAGHALVGWMLKHTDALLKVSIIPRVGSALGITYSSVQEKYIITKDEFCDKMCMALGGRVAETLIFDTISTGAQDDLRRASELAKRQVIELGMGESMGHMAFQRGDQEQSMTRAYSETLQNSIDIEVRDFIAKATQRTAQILRDNMHLLKLLASKLLEKEMLNYHDIEALLGPPPYGNKRKLIALDWENIDINNGSSEPENAAKQDKEIQDP